MIGGGFNNLANKNNIGTNLLTNAANMIVNNPMPGFSSIGNNLSNPFGQPQNQGFQNNQPAVIFGSNNNQQQQQPTGTGTGWTVPINSPNVAPAFGNNNNVINTGTSMFANKNQTAFGGNVPPNAFGSILLLLYRFYSWSWK